MRLDWMRMMKILAIFTFLWAQALAMAEVLPVAFTEKGFLYSDAPTLTFVWPSPQAKTTLIFIPGGEGRIGLTPERRNLGGFYAATLKPLSDPQLTSGSFNVVVFDSPVNLPVGSAYPYSRQSSEHLLRIESVVRHYKELYGLPVWIMGHSNGAVSITEFYKMLQKKNQETLVQGAIFSSARNGANFNDSTKLPILFLAHEKDGCQVSLPSASRSVYEQQRKTNSMKTEYVLVKGGEAQVQNACSSGFHMFYGAGEEAYGAIDEFVRDELR
jgi:hypothetical protein